MFAVERPHCARQGRPDAGHHPNTLGGSHPAQQRLATFVVAPASFSCLIMAHRVESLWPRFIRGIALYGTVCDRKRSGSWNTVSRSMSDSADVPRMRHCRRCTVPNSLQEPAATA